MYAVIFKARLADPDEQYTSMASELRKLAIDVYGCMDFVAMVEGDTEVAISWWDTLNDIAKWKADPMHKQAQAMGREKWYKGYTVQVVKVEKEYSF